MYSDGYLKLALGMYSEIFWAETKAAWEHRGCDRSTHPKYRQDDDYLEKMTEWHETRFLDVSRQDPTQKCGRLWRDDEGIGHLLVRRGGHGYFSEGNHRLFIAYDREEPIFPISVHNGCPDPPAPASGARDLLLWKAVKVVGKSILLQPARILRIHRGYCD